MSTKELTHEQNKSLGVAMLRQWNEDVDKAQAELACLMASRLKEIDALYGQLNLTEEEVVAQYEEEQLLWVEERKSKDKEERRAKRAARKTPPTPTCP